MNDTTSVTVKQTESFRDRMELAYIVLAALVISFAAHQLQENSRIYMLLTIAFYFGGLYFSEYTPLCIRLSTLYSARLMLLGNAFYLILWALTLGPIILEYVQKRKGNLDGRTIILLMVSAVIFFASCTFGVETRYTSMIMQLLYILAYLCASTMADAKRLRLVMYSFIMSGLFVCVVVFTDILNGNEQWIGYRYRLTFNGNERDLANAMTIPTFYFLYKIFGKISADELFSHSARSESKLLNMLKLLPFFVLLFLSYSRGNYLALLAAILYVMFSGRSKGKVRIVLTIGIVVIAALFIIERLQIEMRYDEMMRYEASVNARFNIWTHYFKRMLEDPVRLLFGFGPGDLKRLATKKAFANFYAHSAFLDYLFSFGLFGFALIAFLTVRSIVIPAQNKDIFLTALVILTIVMYLPYGSSATLALHILLGLCAGSVSRKREPSGPQTEKLTVPPDFPKGL